MVKTGETVECTSCRLHFNDWYE